MEDRTAKELIKALDRNTKATNALHALTLEVERERRNEKTSFTPEEAQTIAKTAIRRNGFNIGFCSFCERIDCTAGSPVNNWMATGCRCCYMKHDLVQEK